MKKFISLLLVCLMVIPFGMLAGVSVSADSTKTVYLSDNGEDTNDGTAANKAVKTITKAYELLGTNGGTIAVTGTFTQSADFVAPDHTGKITLKGADASAEYVAPGKRYQSGGPLEITDLKIKQTAANFMVVACFNDLTISSTVVHERSAASFIVAGGQGGTSTAKDRNYTVKSSTLTINGGDWSECIGSVRSSLNSPNSVVHTADEFKNYTLTINVGGNATVGKMAVFSRSFGACNILTDNASCVVNINGGKISGWIGTTDAAATEAAKVGYDKGVTINIGKDFDITKSFTLDAEKQTDNVVTDASGNKIFYGINGDNVFSSHSSKQISIPVEKTKVVIAAELYDSLKNSDRFRGVTVEKAVAGGGNQGGNQGGNTGSTTVEIPAEPTLTSTAVVYTAYAEAYTTNDVNAYSTDTKVTSATTNAGTGINDLYKTSSFSSWVALFKAKEAESTLGAAGALKDGGTMVVAGKALAGLSEAWSYKGTIAATTTPIVITAKDPAGTSYISTLDGAICYTTESGANKGQYGMFMMDAGTTELANTLVFEGDVIFKDIVLLNRASATLASQGKLPAVISAKSKIVIDSTVQFASMTGEQKYVLNVDDGAYAYVHALGFGKYTGKGTIVIGDEIKATATEDMFEGFEGTLVYEDGTIAFADNSNNNNQGGGNPDTSDKTWVVAVLAAVAVMGCGVTVVAKKREN